MGGQWSTQLESLAPKQKRRAHPSISMAGQTPSAGVLFVMIPYVQVGCNHKQMLSSLEDLQKS